MIRKDDQPQDEADFQQLPERSERAGYLLV